MDYKFKANKNGNCRMCDKKDEVNCMICCDECDRWFHVTCTELSALPKRRTPWLCIKCAAIADYLENQQKAIQSLQEAKTDKKPKSDSENAANLTQDLHVKALQAIVETMKEVKIDNRASTDTFMSEVVELPNSYKTALSRFLMLEKKLSKDTVVKDWYHDKIDEYLQKDYMRKLSPEEALIETPKTFYLPHFI
uniref:Uncharacterized protein n=2 Tax=Culex quinquefasciatus TaxID=7176 RepID=A0A1S4J933_CULQU